jgi:hypothetical protein
MAIAAPPRPTAAVAAPGIAPRQVTGHGTPDWLPTLGWFVERGNLHSRINVVPLGNSRILTERFGVTLKFFRGAAQPVHVVISEPFAGDNTYRFEGQKLLDALGVTEFEGLVEITVRSLENPPREFAWADSWLEFFADDGTFSGSVPGFVFKGGTTKRVMSGKWQHWPGVAANPDYATTLLVLNYHPRPVELRFDVFAPSGRVKQSPVLTLAPHLPHRIEIDEVIPDLRELIEEEGGFGSMRIWSTYKLPGFVAIRNRRSGVTVSFDHTVPFAGPPVD